MKKILSVLLLSAAVVNAQPYGPGPAPAGSSSLVVGTTTIIGGASGNIEYNNAGVLGEKTVSGTGLVLLQTGPSIVNPSITGASITTSSYNGLTITASTGTLTIANAKTATISNTLTFTGTDSSSIAFGTGGTVLYNGGALGTPASGNGSNITNVNAATLGGATFAAPGAIGGTTASAGTFTTVTGTSYTMASAYSGYGFGAYQSGSTQAGYWSGNSNTGNGSTAGDFYGTQTDGSGLIYIGTSLALNIYTSGTKHYTFKPDGSLTFAGTAPTPTGTGSPTIASGSTDTAGEVTSGASATSVVITFATAKTNAPFCTVTPQTQLAAFAYTISTTAITITQTATTGEKIDYHCFQH